jgi:hypothetical protein
MFAVSTAYVLRSVVYWIPAQGRYDSTSVFAHLCVIPDALSDPGSSGSMFTASTAYVSRSAVYWIPAQGRYDGIKVLPISMSSRTRSAIRDPVARCLRQAPRMYHARWFTGYRLEGRYDGIGASLPPVSSRTR